jgi:hypothetical protein
VTSARVCDGNDKRPFVIRIKSETYSVRQTPVGPSAITVLHLVPAGFCMRFDRVVGFGLMALGSLLRILQGVFYCKSHSDIIQPTTQVDHTTQSRSARVDRRGNFGRARAFLRGRNRVSPLRPIPEIIAKRLRRGIAFVGCLALRCACALVWSRANLLPGFVTDYR